MEIIIKGTAKKKLYRFFCTKCGTVYSADADEVIESFWGNETYFRCNCPFCKQDNYTDKEINND